MNTMPGTAKVIAIFVLSLKENVPDVRHYTYFIVRYFFFSNYILYLEFCNVKQGAQMIRQYARWILLSWTFTFRLVCKPLKKLYPNLESLQNVGKLTILPYY